MWDLESGQTLRTLEGHTGEITAVAVTPDGQRAITVSADKMLKLWDVEKGQELLALQWCARDTVPAPYSSNDRLAAIFSDELTLSAIDLLAGKTLAAFSGDSNFLSCGIAADGSTVVVGERSGTVHFLRFASEHVGVVPPEVTPKQPTPTLEISQTDSGKFDVFMAHNNQDKAAVLEVSKALKDRGLRPWVDVEQIPPEQLILHHIQAIIPRVRSAAIFIGVSGLGKSQTFETVALVQECIDRGIPVIPVLLPGVDRMPAELVILKQFSWVRFIKTLGENETLRLLVWGITNKNPAE